MASCYLAEVFPSLLLDKSLNNIALVISGTICHLPARAGFEFWDWNSEISWWDLLCKSPEFDFLRHTYDYVITVFPGKTMCMGMCRQRIVKTSSDSCCYFKNLLITSSVRQASTIVSQIKKAFEEVCTHMHTMLIILTESPVKMYPTLTPSFCLCPELSFWVEATLSENSTAAFLAQ